MYDNVMRSMVSVQIEISKSINGPFIKIIFIRFMYQTMSCMYIHVDIVLDIVITGVVVAGWLQSNRLFLRLACFQVSSSARR
jgi:hypothetical protein